MHVLGMLALEVLTDLAGFVVVWCWAAAEFGAVFATVDCQPAEFVVSRPASGVAGMSLCLDVLPDGVHSGKGRRRWRQGT